MIATRRGLAILGALAALVLVLVVLDLGRSPAVTDRSLVPGLDVAQVTSLRWADHQGGMIELARSSAAADDWAWTSRTAVVDRARLDVVLSTLRGAHWHRRDRARVLDRTSVMLRVIANGVPHDLGFGGIPAGDDAQVWISDATHGLLVDAWVARALAPSTLDLMVRRPFADAAAADPLAIGAVTLTGPRPHAPGSPRELANTLVAAPLVAELEAALAALELVTSPSRYVKLGPPSGVAALRVGAGALMGSLGGPCRDGSDQVELDVASGSGCVERAASDRLRALAVTFARPVAELAEPRPVPADIATITLADGGVLDLAKRPLIDGSPVDPARVAELLAVLAAPATIIPPPPLARPDGTLTVVDRRGRTFILELVAPHAVRRQGEPVVLDLTPAAFAVLTRPAGELRDLGLWVEEPTLISAIELDGTRYTRGATVGEWTSGALTPAQLETLATRLAAPRRVRGPVPTFRTVHRITLTITPPTGAPITHTLELGPRGPTACPARADGVAVLLAPELCD